MSIQLKEGPNNLSEMEQLAKLKAPPPCRYATLYFWTYNPFAQQKG